MKTTDLLAQDHQHMLEALNILGEMAERTRLHQVVDRKDLETLIGFFKGFGDLHHQGKEEAVLFPALLLDRDQKHYRQVCGCIFEHNRERSLIEGLQESILAHSFAEFVYYAGRLNELMRAHIREEEKILFPIVNKILTPSDDARVFQDMAAYDKAWQQTHLSEQLDALSELKLRYLETQVPRGQSGIAHNSEVN
jgi:hemerythrin-like domain-containing protein